MFTVKRIVAVGTIVAALFIPYRAQKLNHPSFNEILGSAMSARNAYVGEFKNLISNETRTFTRFRKNGDIFSERSVTSTFVVYQLAKADDRITEYRNVTAVNGRRVVNRSRSVEDFFTSVREAESSVKELARIEAESQKYDSGLTINGFTLFQGVVLSKELMELFSFTLSGKEDVDGVWTYIIDYRQTSSSDHIKANTSKAPDIEPFGVYYDSGIRIKTDLNARLSGRMWIDASSFRILRERRTMTVRPNSFSRPVVVMETDFRYQRSEFGIFTPRKIVHTHYEMIEKEQTSRPVMSVTMEYKRFWRPDVDVKIVETTDQ